MDQLDHEEQFLFKEEIVQLANALGEPFTSASNTTMPMMVMTNPAAISVRCAYFLASRSAASDVTRMPAVAAVKITPVSIAS